MNHPLGRWPIRRVTVRGPSMAPTLRDGATVLVRRSARARVGDVVLVRWASRPGQLSIKRVARPGYFVVGDNQLASTDSNQLGMAEVLGVVIWPIRAASRSGPGMPRT
ncbi:phage repressor protein C with HTH and peptisase S24 domain [Kibdelosporangium banguiense]|uniref:Phage repressor protein C with HTH and peptisase S24 domain n=1 Tax=Kibdelosporangium banguiense TaxID=1365924 RepID=A0ABS4TEQ9_9PSEU|nr:S26 family signal peptidase [Kibdelosporangium banguiense]MBP2322906.1 phage repressor protein C with HTH and peptisase S24 domain [Kibdelosporangium banguiense]